MELEWKICGRKSSWDMVRKGKGNGMEFFSTNQVETNIDGMELKWKHSSDKVNIENGNGEDKKTELSE